MSRPALVIALVVLATAVTALAQSPMRPGRWEVSMEMEMPGMPMKMPAMKTTQCVTPEQVKDPGQGHADRPWAEPEQLQGVGLQDDGQHGRVEDGLRGAGRDERHRRDDVRRRREVHRRHDDDVRPRQRDDEIRGTRLGECTQ